MKHRIPRTIRWACAAICRMAVLAIVHGSVSGCGAPTSDSGPGTERPEKLKDTVDLTLRGPGDSVSFTSSAEETWVRLKYELPPDAAYRITILEGREGDAGDAGVYRKSGDGWAWLPESGGLLVNMGHGTWESTADAGPIAGNRRQLAAVLQDPPGSYALTFRYRRQARRDDTCLIRLEIDSLSRHEPNHDSGPSRIDLSARIEAELWPVWDRDRFTFSVPRDTLLAFSIGAESGAANMHYALWAEGQDSLEPGQYIFGTLTAGNLSATHEVRCLPDVRYFLSVHPAAENQSPFAERGNAYFFGFALVP